MNHDVLPQPPVYRNGVIRMHSTFGKRAYRRPGLDKGFFRHIHIILVIDLLSWACLIILIVAGWWIFEAIRRHFVGG